MSRFTAKALNAGKCVPLLMPLVGMADAIVDLVSTGNTLKANHLVEVEQIMEISSRLVVNQAALKLKRDDLQAAMALIRKEVADAPLSFNNFRD